MKRKAVFAGRFYPGSQRALKEEIASCVKEGVKRAKAIGIISPHAGYIYSGKVAGEVYSSVELPDKFIILAPNHTGMGEYISVFPEGEWETPLGSIKVDDEISSAIIKGCEKAKQDEAAHMMEHSLEVQLPFIQYFKKSFTISPVTLGHISLEDCKRLGLAIANVIRNSKENILIVASSDMTHYESAREAEKKDRLAIEKVEQMDPEGLHETVRRHNISMCGVIPATVMLFAAKELGGKKGTLVKYSNSGETSGDFQEVVGYAGLYVS
jgi:MEMO1 family protein